MADRDLLFKTIVLTEDHRFYHHFGIDPIAVARAIAVNLHDRKYSQGGSTITQQLARNLYLTPKKTLIRKVKEMFIAFWLELKYTKPQILQMYVDNVYMGNHDGEKIKGFDKAAVCYFDKSLRHMSVAQIAALVAMLRGPNLYKPTSPIGIARRVLVLGRMLSGGLITYDEFFEASRVKFYLKRA